MAVYVVQEIIEIEPQEPKVFLIQAQADLNFDEICIEQCLIEEIPENDSASRVAGDDTHSVHMWEIAGYS